MYKSKKVEVDDVDVFTREDKPIRSEDKLNEEIRAICRNEIQQYINLLFKKEKWLKTNPSNKDSDIVLRVYAKADELNRKYCHLCDEEYTIGLTKQEKKEREILFYKLQLLEELITGEVQI